MSKKVSRTALCPGAGGGNKYKHCCPQEEGEDFPHGEDCPVRTFWKGAQGSGRMG